MTAREKKQCQIRFYADEFERIRSKCKEEEISYQRLGEVLFGAFLKNDKHIMKLVRKFVESNKNKKNLTELDRNELFRMLEDNSPIKELGI